MTAGKFLSIYDNVSRMIDVDPAAEVRFEYGDGNFFPSNYHVESITEAAGELRVELRPPQTTCKARDRRAIGATSCCQACHSKFLSIRPPYRNLQARQSIMH